MREAIDVFGEWAEVGKDEGMERGHAAAVEEMLSAGELLIRQRMPIDLPTSPRKLSGRTGASIPVWDGAPGSEVPVTTETAAVYTLCCSSASIDGCGL